MTDGRRCALTLSGVALAHGAWLSVSTVGTAWPESAHPFPDASGSHVSRGDLSVRTCRPPASPFTKHRRAGASEGHRRDGRYAMVREVSRLRMAKCCKRWQSRSAGRHLSAPSPWTLETRVRSLCDCVTALADAPLRAGKSWTRQERQPEPARLYRVFTETRAAREYLLTLVPATGLPRKLALHTLPAEQCPIPDIIPIIPAAPRLECGGSASATATGSITRRKPVRLFVQFAPKSNMIG